MMRDLLVLLLGAAAPVPVPSLPVSPNSGTFECRVRGQDDKPIRIQGELGIAAPKEKGTIRGRALIRSMDSPALDGVYIAEWKGLDFSLYRIKPSSAYIHLEGGTSRKGAVIVQQYVNSPSFHAEWFAGLCTQSFSRAAGKVIQ